MSLRVGTLVRVHSIDGRNQCVGKIDKVCVPGQTSKSGTAGFKYVRFKDGALIGYFTKQLERLT
jgi:hypothetical protein